MNNRDAFGTAGKPPNSALMDTHRNCFACGEDNPTGLHLHFDIGERGAAVAEWMPSPNFSSYPDRLHGGIIATLLDSAIVHSLSARGVAGITGDIRIRYREKVRLCETVQIKGWVDAERLGVYLCRAEVRQSGVRVVEAAAKFMPFRALKSP